MFREMLRKNQALSQEECIDILKAETRGVLSVLGDDGYPYGMPMNHFYNEDDGCVYFHCGYYKSHRTDALRENSKVSFCVHTAGERAEGDWYYTVKSVIAFGRVEIIDDMETIADLCARLSRKFTQDEAYIEKEIKDPAAHTLLLRLSIEHMTGKRVKEK